MPLNSLVTSSASEIKKRPKCTRCNNLDPRGHPSSVYPLDSSRKKNHASLTLIADALTLSNATRSSSGRRNCGYCNVLAQALDIFFDGWRSLRGRVIIDIRETESVRVGLDDKRWAVDKIEIYAIGAFKAPWATLGTVHRIPISAGSDDTFDFARRCIQDCLTNTKHVACKRTPTSSSTSPKRLLDVGRVASPIRLIDTQGRSFQYVALSHRWGSDTILKTTKANWKKLASNIPFDALPPLFQDAIIITRQLGLRYIWIDSLAIIQDSARDWETESSKMGAIYENSYVTLSATDSGDGNARCLVDRRKPVKLTFESSTKKEYTLGARKIIEHHPDLGTGDPAKLVGPLTKRAWTLQEHVLSTRILHYTATELVFECKTSCRCECRPTRRISPTTPALIPKALANKGSTFDAIWFAWHRVVEQYSKRDLTVPNDKLPAISGVASKIKSATGSSYAAGLWMENLAADLLWSSTESHGQALDSYRAPTFSWASLDVPITYYEPDEEERLSFTSLITTPSLDISLSGLNSLGSVLNGVLGLSGPCLDADLSSELQAGLWRYTLLIKGTSSVLVHQDCVLVECETQANLRTVQRATKSDERSPFKAPILCLGVVRYDSWISGLVLGMSPRVPSTWERLGTFAVGTDGFARATPRDITLV